MLFLSGQIAIDPRLGDVVYTEDVVKQTEQVMKNIEKPVWAKDDSNTYYI